MIIQDGIGRGYTAKVTADNRLATEATTRGASSQASRNGKAYAVVAANLPVTSTGGVMLFLRNDSQAESVLIDQVTISGDSTKLVAIEYIDYTVGTLSDKTDTKAYSMNTQHSATKLVTACFWDGTNHGIGGFSGDPLALGAYTLSTTPLNVNHGGDVIIGPGMHYVVYLDNNSGGAQTACITVKFFMETI
jgi:hypothetical protein